MFEVRENDGEAEVFVSGIELDVLDAGDDFILAECSLDDLISELAEPLPIELQIQIGSEDGFGTYLFHELILAHNPDGVSLAFSSHTPNKYWEGQYGLATFLVAVRDQFAHHDNWRIREIELEDDWKGITVERITTFGVPLHQSILAAATDLKSIVHHAEAALSGMAWKEVFFVDEDAFCRELLHPLLRRMGFLFVRYSAGRKEYGKDFTFSEITPFGNHRHYGLQAKAGDVSGGVNAAIDELLGQIQDAFAMPYYELGSKDQRFISTFVIAISGKFTENAREKIVEKMPKGCIGSVYFLDRERLTELVERFWKIGS